MNLFCDQRSEFVNSLLNETFFLTVNGQDIKLTIINIVHSDHICEFSLLADQNIIYVTGDITSTDFRNTSTVIHWLYDVVVATMI